jgi:hypothetical protein
MLVLIQLLLGLPLLLLQLSRIVLLQPQDDGIETGDEVSEYLALALPLGLGVVLGYDLVEISLYLVLVALVLVALDLNAHPL